MTTDTDQKITINNPHKRGSVTVTNGSIWLQVTTKIVAEQCQYRAYWNGSDQVVSWVSFSPTEAGFNNFIELLSRHVGENWIAALREVKDFWSA